MIFIFFAGATAYRYGRFGRGNGSIYLDNLNCYGSESRLIDCYHSGIGIHNCDHSDDASLRCQRKYFNCHCIKAFVEGCGKIIKLCTEQMRSEMQVSNITLSLYENICGKKFLCIQKDQEFHFQDSLPKTYQLQSQAFHP